MTMPPGHDASAAATDERDRGIEVVRRLVEKEEVVTAGDELREGELRLLSTREGAGVLERLVAGEAEHPEQAAQLDVGRERVVAHVVEQGASRHDAFVLLRVVTQRHAEAELDRAGVGGGLAGEDAQQARLAGAVEPEHQQALAPLERERHVLEDRRPVVGLRDALDLEQHSSRMRRRGELHRERAVLRRALLRARP